MRSVLRAASAGLLAVALGLAGAGCAHDETNSEPAASESSTTSASAAVLPDPPKRDDGTSKTLHDYIVEHDIAEYPFTPGDPGTPAVEFAMPPGWSALVAEDTPQWAYGGIVYDQPTDPGFPPVMLAITNKLVGDVDPAEVLRYAAGLLLDLPDFEPTGPSEQAKFAGFDAAATHGTYTHDGKEMVVGELTTVIPGKDGAFYVIQLQATALAQELQIVIDAVNWTDDNTKITAP